MRFGCEHCGRLLSVPDGQAGKKGRCPRCKKLVTIPSAMVEQAIAPTGPDAKPDMVTSPPPRDRLLLDLPPADMNASPQTTEEAYERLRAIQGNYLLKEREEPPKRPLPWVIDVFLYPLNKPGLIVLLIGVCVPFFMRVLTKSAYVLLPSIPVLFVFLVPLIILHWASLLMSLLYVNWYAVECIRDSAAGGIRAVDTTASTPGFAELLSQSLTVILCLLACIAPAAVYGRNHGGDAIFWTLFGIGGFLFPMALLAVTTFESLRALNPALLLGSIFSTLLPYCALVAFCYPLCLVAPLPARYLLDRVSWHFSYPLLFLAYYHLLIVSHVVGRFSWKNQERLNWDA